MSLEINIEKKLDGFTLRAAFTAGNTSTALLGASGCGKSMTLRCIAGIVKPDRGRIVLDGRVPLARFVRSTVPLHFARSPCRVPAAISGRARAGAASTASLPFSKFRLTHENSPLSSSAYSPARSSSSVTAMPGCKPQLRSTAPARARCPVVRLP